MNSEDEEEGMATIGCTVKQIKAQNSIQLHKQVLLLKTTSVKILMLKITAVHPLSHHKVFINSKPIQYLIDIYCYKS